MSFDHGNTRKGTEGMEELILGPDSRRDYYLHILPPNEDGSIDLKLWGPRQFMTMQLRNSEKVALRDWLNSEANQDDV